MTASADERVRTLLLRGDNLLKSASPERYPRARAAFEEARDVAAAGAVAARVRELVERRLATLDALEGGRVDGL